MSRYQFVITRSGLERWVWELVDTEDGARVLARSPRSYRRRRKAYRAAELVQEVAAEAAVVHGGGGGAGTAVLVARLTPLDGVQPIVVREGGRGRGRRGQGAAAGRGTSRARPDGAAVGVPVAQA